MRRITFRNLAPGHWVNTETGVELIRGTIPAADGRLRWYVFTPDRSRDGRRALTARWTLADARRYARLDTVPVAREALALAYDEAADAPAPPYRGAPAVLKFPHSSSASASGGTTWYTTPDGRYTVVGRPVAGTLGSDINPDRAFTPYRGSVAVGPSHRRLRDAKQAAQRDWDTLCKAHASALLDEAARVAGDPHWAAASSGQLMQAMAEDIRRSNERNARAGTGPRQLSGWGALRAAHAAATA